MKKFVLLLGIVSITAVCFGFIQSDEPKYQNLKVLPKNTTKQQMDSIMRHFSLSLGVRCGFCHVRNEEQNKFDFAADDKRNKKVARQMFAMMKKINEKYFDEDEDENKNRIPVVSCYTCHNGKEHPQNIPPMPQKQEGGAH